MRGGLRMFMAILFCLCLPILANGDLSIEELLKGVRKNYGQGNILKAEYVRKTLTRVGSLTGQEQAEGATGILYFQPPDKLRLEQKAPSPEVLLTDGKRIYWHILERGELYIYDFKAGGAIVRAITEIFRGMEGSLEIFQPEVQSLDGGYKIRFIPREPRDDFVELTSLLDMDLRITGISIKNLAGGITTFSFKNQEFPKKAPKDLFVFQIPEGVKVIDETQTSH